VDTQKVQSYWLDNAKDAWETAQQLVVGGKNHHALFFAHLTLESLIKAYLVSATGQHPLPIHDLRKLLSLTDISLNQSQIDDLNEITSFCVEARYPEHKLALYQKATPEYTKTWLKKVEEYSLWLKTKLNQT
jgi:HEPN domain-containing protein